MQCLDIVCRDDLGVRHFHEARKLATKTTNTIDDTRDVNNPWQFYLQNYLQACQDSYFEI